MKQLVYLIQITFMVILLTAVLNETAKSINKSSLETNLNLINEPISLLDNYSLSIALSNRYHGKLSDLLRMQSGSTINGMVFDLDKKGLSDVDVELLDEYSSLISRSRTVGGGRFTFRGLQKGTYVVRVVAGRLGYEEQSQAIQLISFNRGTSGASNDSAYLDFYLKPLKRVSLSDALNLSDTIFVQEVPSEAKKIYAQANLDFDQKKNDSGLANLRKAIDVFPTYFLALNRLGEELVKQQDYKAAQIVLRKAIEVNPRSGSSLYLMGYAQYVSKQFKDANESLSQSVTWSPKSAAAFLLLGMCLRQMKLFNEAETQLVKAEVLGKKKLPDIYWQLALLYGNDMGKYTEAADQLETFLKLQPRSKEEESVKKLIQKFRDRAKKGS